MNKLVKNQDLETALQEEIASGGGFGPLLKFDANTSKYTIDKSEVPLGRKFIAHIPQYARGWVLFWDKSTVDYKVHKSQRASHRIARNSIRQLRTWTKMGGFTSATCRWKTTTPAS